MHKTSVTDWLTYVQNIMQPSFVGPFNVVGPRHLPTIQLCGAIIRPRFVVLLRRDDVLYHGNVTRNGYSDRYETSTTDEQRRWNHAIQFARWQHHAVGRGAWFAVTDATCFMCF